MLIKMRAGNGAWPVFAGILAAFCLIGCGGGGGSAPVVSLFGRSYNFASGSQKLEFSVDALGRFTVTAFDNGVLLAGAGAQGTIASNGAFVAQTDDTATQFSGNIVGGGLSATGLVTHSGVSVFSFSATSVVSGTATPSAFAGSFTSSGGTTAAYLSVDATSHASLWANVAGQTGGALVNLASDGTFASADGGTVGAIGLPGTSYTLTITKLNGVTVSGSANLNKVSRARWTFLVYLNGANDLQTFGPLNFNQMEKIGSTADVNMVVQWKQATCSTCGSPDWTGTRRYFVTKDNNVNTVNSAVVQDLGNTVDMGSWRELNNFIQWGQRNYPADHYAIVIWNHGAGWYQTRGDRTRPTPRSVSLDDERHTEIQVWDLPQALNVTPKLDLLVFDASLMQMTEVAYELRNSIPWIVGSEESPPGEGYVYDGFLADLVANPNMSASQLGSQIVTRTLEAYGPSGDNTQSLIDSSKMQGVADSLNTFGNTLINHIGDSAAVMTSARNNSQHYKYSEFKDLWHYAQLIKAGTTKTDLQNAATGVQNAINAATVTERHGSQRANSHGMSIYLQDPGSYSTNYANLAISRLTSWPEWVRSQP